MADELDRFAGNDVADAAVCPNPSHGQRSAQRIARSSARGARANGQQSRRLALIGLQDGDRLESINGYSPGSPEQALTEYAHLRVATRLDLKIARRGQPLTLGYRID